ncbi:hypothetical protein [Nitrosomonas sp.]|uniref:hypothetical protein n=1 Tax=Nitrosomonas sp. TaxID=42353 RepID=UPI00261F5F36|nr:hypothetical protein [Nitrosomonas sp.]
MKTSHFFLSTAVKVSFILFGIMPVIGLILFGAMPISSIVQSVINWAGMDIILGVTVFLGYLIITAIRGVLKKRTYHSSMRISA